MRIRRTSFPAIVRTRVAVLFVAALTFAAAPGTASAQSTVHDTVVTMRATGTFEVKMAPQATDAPIGRMSLDKQFHGDLEGSGKGEMLAGMTAVEGSAAYVALEQVTATLHGRSGTFLLLHRGVMDRGAQSLSVTVVPDSGTGELVGLTGALRIINEGGQHAYELDYTLPAAR